MNNETRTTARILVVDDEPVNRLVITHVLQQRGYDVTEAQSAQVALPLVLDEDFDLILMDLHMPGLSGLQAARLIRQVKSQLELPIIIATSSAERGVVLEAFRSGVNDFITKPIDPEIATARIELQLQLKLAQSALQQSEERYALAAEGSNDGLWDWNLQESQLYCSDRMKAMLGLPIDALQSVAEWFELMHEEDASRVKNDLDAHIGGESKHFESELRMLHRDDGYRWMLCRGLAVRDSSGVAIRIAGSLTDITEGKVADALTGLPNRLLFVDRVQRCLTQAVRYPTRRFAVLYLDVDGFKAINDSYGHEVGDEYLVVIARRLEASIRNCDSVVSRLGGDEFAILVENLTAVEGAVAVAERIKKALDAPIRVAGRELFARASIDITVNSQRCHQAEELLREADVAMYFAKENAHVPYRIFKPEMTAETAARLEMGNELRNALVRNEMTLYFQPIVDIQQQRTAGFEALLRWESGQLGQVSPADFIPLAEDTGIIVELGEYVIHQACKYAEHINRLADRPLMMSVNISTRQMIADGLVEVVNSALDASKIPRDTLKLEITETAVMDDPDASVQLLNRLQNQGVKIGLDDFGTGYSSLAYLHRLPLDVLKVDRSFVSEMFSSEENMSIVETILTLARSLDLEVIAEGVETLEQLQRLSELGCRYVQGYLFSEPLPPSMAATLVNYQWEQTQNFAEPSKNPLPVNSVDVSPIDA